MTPQQLIAEVRERLAKATPGRQWMPLPGYEDRYWVSDHGDVFAVWREPKQLCIYWSTEGYAKVRLFKDRKFKYGMVSRLVLIAFRGLDPSRPQAAHINGNNKDNRLANLMWATNKENSDHRILHGTQTRKLEANQVREIRRLLAKGLRHGPIAKKFNVSRSNISLISEGKAWTHLKND